jgi:hypothetical protein
MMRDCMCGAFSGDGGTYPRAYPSCILVQMIRTLIVLVLFAVPFWAPWMDVGGSDRITKQVFDAFGPLPSSCYDSDAKLLMDGLEVRWYPFGRLVHACSGDYVVWMWGGVKELGGVSKKASDLGVVQAKALTCDDVLKRQDARRATTTDNAIVRFEGTPAAEPDFSIFPAAASVRTVITKALHDGPNFAGSFTVASWDCGANCQQHAVIDVATGQVIAFGLPTEYGVKYSLDSTLLITNPVENMPPLPETAYDTETVALSIARLPREYFQLTTDALSGTQYLVRQCVENSAAGYIAVEDDRLGVVPSE